jgi:DNA-binding SARP family transcriptional activator
MGEGRTSKALRICNRALEYDPGFEAAYRLMMKIYHGVGDRPSIFRTYSTCEEEVRRICDGQPSLETQELYQRLMNR